MNSQGTNFVEVFVSDGALDPMAGLRFVTASDCGAESLFVGTVRDHNHGKVVESVSYDAHSSLCKKTFEEIAQEARVKLDEPRIRISISHRVGELKPGEASVVIAVGAPHRDEAFRACRYVIEQIKVRSPIWKKERYENGETAWLRGHQLCSHGGHDSETDLPL